MTGLGPALYAWKAHVLPTTPHLHNATVKRRGSRAPKVRLNQRRWQVYQCVLSPLTSQRYIITLQSPAKSWDDAPIGARGRI